MLKYFCIYLLICSALTFCSYGLDKLAAKRGAWRTPERRLLLLGFLGGSIGALLGMLWFHHKTRKTRFWLINLLGIAWQVAVIIYFGLFAFRG